MKIIDDEASAYNKHQEIEDEGELYATNEEAPQIVGIIDERAPLIIMRQEYQESGKWKSLEDSKIGSDSSKSVIKKRQTSVESPIIRCKEKSSNSLDESPPRRRNSDESPPISL